MPKQKSPYQHLYLDLARVAKPFIDGTTSEADMREQLEDLLSNHAPSSTERSSSTQHGGVVLPGSTPGAASRRGEQMSETTKEDGPTIRTYVEILYPGIFMPEEEVREVPSRDVDEVLATLRPAVFAFRFFARTEHQQGDEVLRGAPRDFSGYHYLGTEYSLEQVERGFPGDKYAVLRSNLRNNGHTRAVLCRTGNWRPLEPKDLVHPAPPRGAR